MGVLEKRARGGGKIIIRYLVVGYRRTMAFLFLECGEACWRKTLHINFGHLIYSTRSISRTVRIRVCVFAKFEGNEPGGWYRLGLDFKWIHTLMAAPKTSLYNPPCFVHTKSSVPLWRVRLAGLQPKALIHPLPHPIGSNPTQSKRRVQTVASVCTCFLSLQKLTRRITK